MFVNLPVREGPRSLYLETEQWGSQVSASALFSKVEEQLGIPASSFVLSLSGRPLSPSELLSPLTLQSARFDVYLKALGGGGDGGSTGAESRSCYLEMYKGQKKEKADPREEALARWTRCRLSNETLTEPCVCDELGNLYNKEAVLTALLSKSVPKSLFHLSLKTVTDLKLTRNEAAAPELDKDGAMEHAPFACPVTGLPMNGRFRFVVDPSSGHVFSDKALKTAPMVVEEAVGRKVGEVEWLPLCPQGEELEGLKLKVAQRVALAEAKKKAKKSAKGEATEAAVGEKRKASSEEANGEGAAAKKEKKEGANGVSLPPKPSNASDKVWNSLFLTEKEKEDTSRDFLVRGTLSRGQRIGG